ncbi:hypothetical protein FHX52_2778 [Humibacillus xanthopallidus]|uniref:Uncharacterized protein n=1 Tax=Humibacillus xanthopallidus TaxID=412689 RepID=A0A543PPR7_9MICO|nr:hypothetical protein [Humibacillus xanthopallidus]TQN46072.1 hypothetical protein FHX52_2778 [Humibacillus xanthopallidus]
MTSTSRASRSRDRGWAPVIGSAVAAGALALAVTMSAHGQLWTGRAGAAAASSPAGSSSARANLIRECDASLALASALTALPTPAVAPSSPRGVAAGGGAGGGAMTSLAALRSRAGALAVATTSPDLRELLQNAADDAAAHEVGLRTGDLERQRDTALALRGDAAGLRRWCTGRAG